MSAWRHRHGHYKSISRFARNTLTCLKYIRQLKKKSIPVFFGEGKQHQLHGFQGRGHHSLWLLLHNRKASPQPERKLGLQYRYQQGEIQVNCNRFSGLQRMRIKRLIVVPEEAEIIRRIYREYLERASMLKSSAASKRTAFNGAGNEKWHTSNINQILRNENTSRRPVAENIQLLDFLTKTRVKNHGVVPQYYVWKTAMRPSSRVKYSCRQEELHPTPHRPHQFERQEQDLQLHPLFL